MCSARNKSDQSGDHQREGNKKSSVTGAVTPKHNPLHAVPIMLLIKIQTKITDPPPPPPTEKKEVAGWGGGWRQVVVHSFFLFGQPINDLLRSPFAAASATLNASGYDNYPPPPFPSPLKINPLDQPIAEKTAGVLWFLYGPPHPPPFIQHV